MWSKSVEILNPHNALTGEKKKEPKTNADRIRAMNDEELIKLLTGFCAFACIFPDKDCEHGNCEECCKEWLQSPAEMEGKLL